MKPIIIEPEAEADIAEAFGWYENQRLGGATGVVHSHAE